MGLCRDTGRAEPQIRSQAPAMRRVIVCTPKAGWASRPSLILHAALRQEFEHGRCKCRRQILDARSKVEAPLVPCPREAPTIP